MQRVSGANFLANGAGAGKNTYQDYNPATGQAGTTPNASALTAMQEEIASLVEWQGLALNPADNTQLRQAIIAYVASQTATYETVAEATSALAAAIAGVDTPAEVAAAISAALAGYAPLASPALTGTPTAPTPATGTNSTVLATTAFVQAQLVSTLGAYETSAAATSALATAVAGLDNPSEVAAAIAAALVTYAPLASPALTGTPTAPAAPANDNSGAIANTSWIWGNIQALVASCIAAVATAAGFACSVGSANWYVKFPSWLGGWIVQSGTATFSGIEPHGTVVVPFPIEFPTACYSAFANPIGENSNGGAMAANIASAPSQTGVTVVLDIYSTGATATGTMQVLAWGK